MVAVAGIYAGAYYFLEKKNLNSCRLTDDEEDEDTAEEETDEEEKTSRTYVSLTKEKEGAETSKEKESHKEVEFNEELEKRYAGFPGLWVRFPLPGGSSCLSHPRSGAAVFFRHKTLFRDRPSG